MEKRDWYVRSKFANVSNYSGAEGPKLKTQGCGCCSREVILTEENLTEAIVDAENFASELKAIKASINWADVEKQAKEYNE